jgi:hypothetical protein
LESVIAPSSFRSKVLSLPVAVSTWHCLCIREIGACMVSLCIDFG